MSNSTQRFEGSTIEAALAAASARLGEDLQVVDARKVRTGGVLGFFARERFEVVAAGEGRDAAAGGVGLAGSGHGPADTSADGEERVARALATLVEEVDSREHVLAAPGFAEALSAALDGAPASPSPNTSTAPSTAPVSAAPPVPAVGSAEADVAEQARRAGSLDADLAAVSTVTADADLLAPPGPSTAPALVAVPSVGSGGPAWSRDALRDLGIPREILQRLPAEDPGTDLEWTAALARAIAAEVPEPAPLSAAHPLTVSGWSRRAAVDLLVAGVAGYAPHVIHIDGEALPATSTELTLAVRACLPR